MLSSDLAVEPRDWPDTFFVEDTRPDKLLIEYFNDHEIYPYLVDLNPPCCLCYDFQKIITEREDPRMCKHLIAAMRYKNLMGEKPKKLPDTLTFV